MCLYQIASLHGKGHYFVVCVVKRDPTELVGISLCCDKSEEKKYNEKKVYKIRSQNISAFFSVAAGLGLALLF